MSELQEPNNEISETADEVNQEAAESITHGIVSSSPTDTLNVSSNTASGDDVSSSTLDCPVCLQPCVHPVEIPCGHIFCFLCIKGVATQGGQQPRCAICRSNIPTYVLTNPRLKDISQLYKDDKTCSGYKWFYESRSGGWWQYEERTMQELEKAYEAKQTSCQLLIAGHMYDIDFTQMIQFRVGNSNLFRRIKRDLPNAEKRGIAGIRIHQGGPSAQLQHQQQPPNGRRRPSRGSPRSVPSVNVSSVQSSNSVVPSSPVDSQQSEHDEEDDEDEEDVFVDSDDAEDEDDDMELGEEEQESETDDYNIDEELRDGARAPTSRSDRSTSSLTNQTPPPCNLSCSGLGGAASSNRAKTSRCCNHGGNRCTPPTSRSTPNSTTSSAETADNSPSPVSPSFCLSTPSICSPPPTIQASPGVNSGVSTSIQFGPRLRITVDYANPMEEDEIL